MKPELKIADNLLPGDTARRPWWKRMIAFSLILVAVSAALVVVAALPLNPDVAWFMSVARRMLNGDELYRDIVDLNPPLVVYLLIPAVLVSNATGASDQASLKAVMLVITAAAVLWHVNLLGTRRSSWWTCSWITLLVLGLLIIPASDFGQREHIMVVLCLPFLALKYRRIQRLETPAGHAVLVGALAGLGFAIKPHFVLIWLALEAIDMTEGRVSGERLKVRPESITIMTVLISYVVFVAALHSAYFTLILELGPLYGRFAADEGRILTIPFFAIPLLLVLLSLRLSRSRSHAKSLIRVLVVFACASLLAALIQWKGWRYHSLPMIVTTFLAGGVLIELEVRRFAAPSHVGLSSAVCLGLLLGAIYPFGMSLLAAHDLAGAYRTRDDGRAASILKHRPGSMLILGDRVADAFPLVNAIGVRSASPFASMWWIRAIYDSDRGSDVVLLKAPEGVEVRLKEMLVADVVRNPPDLVLVDMAQHARFRGRAFPYVDYFRQDPAFDELWQRYDRIGMMGRFSVWKSAHHGGLP
jgi:hypothetical protein